LKNAYTSNADKPIYLNLNKYGAEGWELCTIFRTNDGGFVYYFKRKIRL
jgi:hypothetical protein